MDLERRRVVDLLADRTSTTVPAWLRQRPGVEVAARDRSTEYARAAAVGAPDAAQVADRWHLLANLRQALERWLHGVHDRLRRLPVHPADRTAASSPPSRQEACRRTGPERAAPAASRARWQARYAEVRRRHETVRDWETKLLPVMGETLRKRRHGIWRRPGRRWHVDETCLKVRGKWSYLHRAVDRNGNLIDAMLSEHRNVAAAKAFFRLARATMASGRTG